MRRLPPLNALRAFEAAARRGTISAAANELGVTHSAVSQQVMQLERYFGQTLFHRPGKRIEPTPSALALLEDVRDALDKIAFATDQLSRRGLSKIVTVNAPYSFATQWLIPRAAGFQEHHPHLELRVSTANGRGDASQLDGPYDFVIRRHVMARSGYTCSWLVDDTATPLMSPRSKFATADAVHFSRGGLLHARSWPDAWRRWLSQYASLRSETLDGPFFDHAALALQAAANNLGAAIAPLALAVEDLAAHRLVAPFQERTIKGPGYHVLHRGEAPDERGTREFLRWLKGETEKSVEFAKDWIALQSNPRSVSLG